MLPHGPSVFPLNMIPPWTACTALGPAESRPTKRRDRGGAFPLCLVLLIFLGISFLVGEARAGSLHVANYNRGEVLSIDTQTTNAGPTFSGSSDSGPFGVVSDRQGNFFVANYGNNTVVKIAAGTTNPVLWASGAGISGPTGLALDNSGNLFVANFDDNSISRIAAGTTNPVLWASGLNGPEALAIDSSGNLYVANIDDNSISRIAAGTTNPVLWASGLNAPCGLRFDGSGNLFVSNYGDSTVARIAAGTTNPVLWASGAGISGPTGLAFDDAGNLFVANFDNNSISRIAAGTTNPVPWYNDLDGPFLLEYAQPVAPLPPVISSQPASLAVTIGQDADFSVTATASGALSYQWKKDGVLLSGATNTRITVSSARFADSGSYVCDVTGTGGTVSSSSATLTVSGLNYSGRDLSSQYLGGTDFTGANFSGASLTNSVLSKSILVNADFTGADLRNSYLDGADFTGAILESARLGGASFDSGTKWPTGFDYRRAGMYGPGVDASGKDLSNQYLGGYDFTGANFSFASLTNSVLSKSTLVNANFSGADLQFSYLDGADFTGANFIGIRLRGASFDSGTKWPAGFDPLHAGMYGPGVDYTGSDQSSQYLGDIDFTGANFTGVSLTNSVLSRSTLMNTDFTAASLKDALLDAVDLSGAILSGTDLRGADLSGATFSNTIVRSITYDGTTKWPAGYVPPASTGIKAQTITFKLPSSVTYGSKPIRLSASSSSRLPITFLSSDPSIASVSGATVTINGSGTVTLRALAEGNATYRSATPVFRQIIVNKAPQKITFAKLIAGGFGSTPITLGATAPGGAVTYTSSNTNVATVSGNLLTFTGAGMTTITAAQQGSRNYLPASSVQQPQVVAKGAQTITFTPPTTLTFVKGSTFPLTARSSSGLSAFTFTTKNTTVLQISGTQAKVVGKGNAVITVNEPGNANYLAAKPFSATVKVQ